ncbi:hypothetical protein L596_019761 [Steinernema carpocapsae]|uniref:G-protein coupled receptors family 1 profile domain-containing protein n=1 Tax=Steinernema carpocapsae TaxID=34508 RepID=A0A4U5MRH9_STECR|nr:hypothetical protein L596_019761 [Steinernema carpocapsae]
MGIVPYVSETMLKSIALIEQGVAALICFLTLCIAVLITHKKPLKAIWRDSPPLLMVFLSNFVFAFSLLILSVEWILMIWDYLVESTVNTAILHYTGVAAMSAKWWYDCSTVAVFLQRVHFLLLPLKNKKSLNLALVSISFVACVTLGFANFAVNVKTAKTEQMAPDGRFESIVQL